MGKKLVKSTCEEITCGTGKRLVGNNCETIKCPTGEKLKGSTCEQVSCGSGKELVGSACKTVCAAGLIRRGTSCVDDGDLCPDGSTKHRTKGCGYTSAGNRFVNMGGTVFNSTFGQVLATVLVAAGTIYIQNKFLPPGGFEGIKQSLLDGTVNLQDELAEWKNNLETPSAWLGDLSSITPDPNFIDDTEYVEDITTDTKTIRGALEKVE
jgi:hypothetical protein